AGRAVTVVNDGVDLCSRDDAVVEPGFDGVAGEFRIVRHVNERLPERRGAVSGKVRGREKRTLHVDRAEDQAKQQPLLVSLDEVENVVGVLAGCAGVQVDGQYRAHAPLGEPLRMRCGQKRTNRAAYALDFTTFEREENLADAAITAYDPELCAGDFVERV